MSKSFDIFTTDSARVPDVALTDRAINQQLSREVDRLHAALPRVRTEAKYRKYFGTPGEFLAGFVSAYGFHIRGRSEVSAALAVDQALKEYAQHPDQFHVAP